MSEPFDLQHYIPYRIAAASALLAFDRDPDVAMIADLALREFRVIMDIGAMGPLKAVDIARTSRVSSSTVSRAVSRLTELDLVVQTEDPADQRGPILSLTDEGERIYARLARRCAERAALIDDALTDAERDCLVTALRRIEHLAEDLLADHAEKALRAGQKLSRDQRDLMRWARQRGGADFSRGSSGIGEYAVGPVLRIRLGRTVLAAEAARSLGTDVAESADAANQLTQSSPMSL